MPEVKDEVEIVDLSPEAKMAKDNLKKARPNLIDIGRLQAKIEEWRTLNPYVSGVVDSRGQPVKMPHITAISKNVEEMDKDLTAIVQDMCEDSEGEIRKKIEAYKRRSDLDGSGYVPAFDTVLAPMRGHLTVPPVISGRP
jgi:hypothetical protein